MSGEFVKTETGFDYNPWGGSDIKHCITLAIAKAKSSHKTVTIRNFNGVDVAVNADTEPDKAYETWSAVLDARAEAYRNSPEGRKAAEEREAQARHCQCEVDRLLMSLGSILRPGQSNLDVLIPWLVEFSEVADHVSVHYDQNALASVLESLGYRESAHVVKEGTEDQRKKAVAKWTRRMKGEYIVGQAINCLRQGLPPHPGLTARFAEEYLATA